jgi:hypothetical protein
MFLKISKDHRCPARSRQNQLVASVGAMRGARGAVGLDRDFARSFADDLQGKGREQKLANTQTAGAHIVAQGYTSPTGTFMRFLGQSARSSFEDGVSHNESCG